MASLLIHSELFGDDKNRRRFGGGPPSRRVTTIQTSFTTSSTNHHQHHSAFHNTYYYASCFVAGGLSSSIRWVLSPLELAKTQMQVASSGSSSAAAAVSTVGSNANTTVLGTLRQIYHTEGAIGWFRGLTPTACSYGIQTSGKYGLYEYIKDQALHNNPFLKEEHAVDKYKGLICVTSAAIAETIADIFMCPFEMCKVQMQTNPNFPRSMTMGMLELIKKHHPWGSLGPLWCRQVPGTVVNFYTFENSVNWLYDSVLQTTKQELNPMQQLGVTFIAGYMAGFCSAVLSHPADSLISLMSQTQHKHDRVLDIIRKVGWYRLFTRGLAPRIVVTGQIISMQWLLYDSIKQCLGFSTSGGH